MWQRCPATLAAVTTGQLIVVAAAIFVAAFVQMLAGFGFALLAMPRLSAASANRFTAPLGVNVPILFLFRFYMNPVKLRWLRV